MLKQRGFVPVTVSNVVKLNPVNCFVLRLHPVSSSPLSAFLWQFGWRLVLRRKYMKRSLWVAAATFGLLSSLWVPVAVGQAIYGSVLGTVTDPSGAAVAGAKVTVTSQTKNVSTTD